MPHRKSFGCLLFLWLMSFVSGWADLPSARFWTISPPGGKAGTSVEVTLSGADLDRADRILFSHTNLTAAPKATDRAADTGRASFTVRIGDDVPPGIYEARVAGRFGISNPRAFVVSALPETTLTATNSSSGQAVLVPLGTILNAHAQAAAIAYYTFNASPGQRVLIECSAREIDSRMEPVLFVSDASGHELARARGGSLIDFTPTSGTNYLLAVHDALFRGGDDYFYRLTLSTGPHIDFIFPAAGVPGTRAKYFVFGRNLPGAKPADEFPAGSGPLQRLEVEIEMPPTFPMHPAWMAGLPLKGASAGLEGMEYRLKATNGVSNPVLITAAAAPLVLETEPNNTPDLAQRVSVPCEFEGQFYPAGDKDWITFTARKGDVFSIEVISQRLGLPTAPFVLAERVTHGDDGQEKGSDSQEIYGADSNLGGVELNTATRDPISKFEAKEDGPCRIEIRDLFNSSRTDPGRLYRLILRKETPDFQLLAAPQSPPQLDKERREAHVWTTFLRRGETVPLKVVTFRRGGFDGEIRLTLQGLPAGLTCESVSLQPGGSATRLLVTASDNAAPWVGQVEIVGTARLGDADVTRTASTGSLLWDVSDYNIEPVQARLTSGFFLAVAADESAPLALQARDQTTFEAHPTDKLQIPLKLTSHAELTGNVKLKAAGSSALDGAKELELTTKTNQASLELDLGQLKIPAGTYPFYVFAQGQTKYRRLAPDEVKAAEEASKAVDPKDKDKAKALAQQLQFEDRAFTAYSGLFTLKINPPPAATTASVKATAP